ncbi:hypothetical protein Bealeia1_01270 [Candidatus Bealeia paramacronuclearis]|uniref:DUF1311 domain-containing protein n=1 Tax=Candidatus Bealeia paramacronuclearis TaxID=1921001 RepID=A0ABZ2C412_9PROT|nr:hypothetical protein [Candidatus Bealeia paramacronuclearis]
MKITHILSALTALTLTSPSLSAANPCVKPALEFQDLCGYLDRYISALRTLETLIKSEISSEEKVVFEKEVANWSNQIQAEIRVKIPENEKGKQQNKIASDYAKRIQGLSKKYQGPLTERLFKQLAQPRKYREDINKLFSFLASNDFENPFPTPANLLLIDSFVSLGEGQFFFEHYTMFGANQGNWIPYRVDTAKKTIIQMTWEECDKDTIKLGATKGEDPGICGYPDYNTTTKKIVNFCKMGCMGSNGIQTTYEISGNALKFVSALSKDNCDGKPFKDGAKPICQKK